MELPFNIEPPFKMQIGENKELVALDKAFVFVTKDDDGKPIRWAIFWKEPSNKTADLPAKRGERKPRV